MAAGAEFLCGVLGDGVASALWWMAAGAEFPCDVLGGGVASALRWMCVDEGCVMGFGCVLMWLV